MTMSITVMLMTPIQARVTLKAARRLQGELARDARAVEQVTAECENIIRHHPNLEEREFAWEGADKPSELRVQEVP